MGTEYIDQLVRWSVGVALVVAGVCWALIDITWASGVVAGAIWAALNLYVVRFLVVRLMRPEARERSVPEMGGIAAGVLFKFPLLYLIGFWLLRTDWFRIEALVAGFSVPCAVAFVEALRRVFVDTHSS